MRKKATKKQSLVPNINDVRLVELSRSVVSPCSVAIAGHIVPEWEFSMQPAVHIPTHSVRPDVILTIRDPKGFNSIKMFKTLGKVLPPMTANYTFEGPVVTGKSRPIAVTFYWYDDSRDIARRMTELSSIVNLSVTTDDLIDGIVKYYSGRRKK